MVIKVVAYQLIDRGGVHISWSSACRDRILLPVAQAIRMTSTVRYRRSKRIASAVVAHAAFAVIEGAQPAFSASEASREGIQRPPVLFSCESASLLPRRSKRVVRCSPRFRRVQTWFETASPFRHHESPHGFRTTTKSVHRRLWPSVDPVGAGHSEPPVKGSRLRSLEPLWDLFLQVPTQKQEASSSTSEGRGGPSAVGRSSSPHERMEPASV